MSQGLLGIWSSNIFLKRLKDDDKLCYLHITVASGEGKETVSAILRGRGRMGMQLYISLNHTKCQGCRGLTFSSVPPALFPLQHERSCLNGAGSSRNPSPVRTGSWSKFPEQAGLTGAAVGTVESWCVCLWQEEEGP